MAGFERLVLVTKRTDLDELVQRFGMVGQARFYLESAGQDFGEVLRQHDGYQRAREAFHAAVPYHAKFLEIERSLLPTFVFQTHTLVATLGPDGLVVNTAKYVADQAVFSVNPDPDRIEGPLLGFRWDRVAHALPRAFEGVYPLARVTMAQAELADGQRIVALNDLFIGARSHVSARYRILWRHVSEDQSSSGIIVSTGAGSTGWYRSLVAGAAGLLGQSVEAEPWDRSADELRFTVREPWPSRTTGVGLTHGVLGRGEVLTVTSQMPTQGAVFSDGVEEDYLPFLSGATVRVSIADQSLHLLEPAGR